jgi:hypothetical protein
MMECSDKEDYGVLTISKHGAIGRTSNKSQIPSARGSQES